MARWHSTFFTGIFKSPEQSKMVRPEWVWLADGTSHLPLGLQISQTTSWLASDFRG